MQNSLVKVYVSEIETAIMTNLTIGKTLKNFKNDDNTINYNILGLDVENIRNPFGWEYLLFIKGDQYQIYAETPMNIIISGNYDPTDNEPHSLVNIDGKLKISINKSNRNIDDILEVIIMILNFWLLYIIVVSYIRRLRDLDKSPWTVLLLFIPFANLYLLIISLFLKWTTGANKYGPDPLQNGNIDELTIVENNNQESKKQY